MGEAQPLGWGSTLRGRGHPGCWRGSRGRGWEWAQRPAWLVLVGSLVFAGRTEAIQKEIRETLSADHRTAALRGLGALPPGRPSLPGRAVPGERGCKQRWAISTDAPGPLRVVGSDES